MVEEVGSYPKKRTYKARKGSMLKAWGVPVELKEDTIIETETDLSKFCDTRGGYDIVEVVEGLEHPL